jgi:hypothetical protein
MKQTAAECQAGTGGTQIDSSKALASGIIVGRADGSAKFFTGGAFLAATPTKAEFAGSFTGTDPSCNEKSVSQGYGVGAQPNTNLNYPMWGLTGGN